MLTRRRQKNTEKEAVRATRRIMVRAPPQRFLNPSKTYKIFDVRLFDKRQNFYIDEELLMSEVTRIDPLSSIFNWNRINGALLTDDHVEFSLTPIQRSFQLPTGYVVDRFKSFGDTSLFHMANKIEELMNMSAGYTKEECSQFASNTELLEGLKGKTYLMMGGQFSNETTKMTHFYVSRQLCKGSHVSEDQLMLLSVRMGCPPIKFISSTTFYAQQCQGYISLMTEYRRLARNLDADGIRNLSAAAHSQQQLQLTTFGNNTSGKCSVKIQIASPVAVVFDFSSIEFDLPELSCSKQQSTDLEDQELSIVRHLLPIPREKLPDFRRKICKYRYKKLTM